MMQNEQEAGTDILSIATTDLQFQDLFDLKEIQCIQDAFSKATGVSS